jgi:hypothetical protein
MHLCPQSILDYLEELGEKVQKQCERVKELLALLTEDTEAASSQSEWFKQLQQKLPESDIWLRSFFLRAREQIHANTVRIVEFIYLLLFFLWEERIGRKGLILLHLIPHPSIHLIIHCSLPSPTHIHTSLILLLL